MVLLDPEAPNYTEEYLEEARRDRTVDLDNPTGLYADILAKLKRES